VTVEDLGSSGGTFVNERRVNGSHRLEAGDRVRLGATTLEVRLPAEPGAEGDERRRRDTLSGGPPTVATAAMAEQEAVTRGASRVRQLPTVPVLAFLTGPRAGAEVPVGDQIVVGRDVGPADVILEDDPAVSRRHASFSPTGHGVTVRDLGSTNGTLVNGERIADAASLHSGDRVEIGGTAIEVRLPADATAQSPGARAPAPAAGELPANGIEVEDLVKQFGDRRVVDGINLHVDPGQIYGFLGPNGAGKSTTVHMLVTLLPPDGGTARVAGHSVTSEGAQVRASIGVALQEAALDPQLNAWEHMDLQTALQGVPRAERKGRGTELLERVGLIEAADRRVGGYSGGMKRRLDLALALVHRPRVLFLDEPTTGLDPLSRTTLWEEVARLVDDEGMTVFLTTQYLEEADALADRVGIIDHGEIVAEDTPAGLKAQIGRPTVEAIPADGADFAAIGQVLERFGELTSSSQRGVAVRLRPGVDGLADVIRALDAEGLQVANVDLHAPTLDDVFLAKTGRSLGGAHEEPAPELDDALRQLSGVIPGVPGPVAGE
jgi:ABC-2 type transport system ATP-binding protein